MKRTIFGVILFLLLFYASAFASASTAELPELDPVVTVAIRIVVVFLVALTVGTAIAAELVTDKHEHR